MAYITPDYYKNDYLGAPAPSDEELNRYIKRASDIIDEVTSYRLYGGKFDKIPDIIQDIVRKATAAQVEFYVVKGGAAEVDAGEGSNMDSVSVGSFSYSGGSGGADSNSGRDAGRISPAALSLLSTTGLLYRGVFVRG
ncbi:hypothetical protein P9G44_18365 [Bacillus paralicheniformis]|uniref:hypothetical protein n=1 Tax=Bacillus paralicheniformis TaxID=1648923 RepID=UPI002DBA6F97|nr:hypothetical protein [Bacillus paralicheniformis]MEC2212645.1 hypothetical protein [Bacillus paralicheniformis]